MSSGRTGAARWKVALAGGAGVAGMSLLLGFVQAPAFAATQDAFELIKQGSLASHLRTYSGTQFVTIFGEPDTITVIADLSHASGAGTTLAMRATSQSPARKVFEPDRDDDSWATLSSPLGGSLIASPALTLLRQHYSARVIGEGVVAGRSARLVELTRASGAVASKMWLDDETSLPLRREIYDQHGRLARLTGYLDFTVVAQHALATQTSVLQSALRSGLLLDSAAVEAWRANGWTIPADLGGLNLVEVRQRSARDVLPVGNEPSADEAATGVLQLVYSDGLSTISVFEQAGHFDATEAWSKRTIAKHKVWAMRDLPRAIAWSTQGKVYTVVADVGAVELEAVVSGLPAKTSHRGLFSRLHRGVNRVGSWLNPFA